MAGYIGNRPAGRLRRSANTGLNERGVDRTTNGKKTSVVGIRAVGHRPEVGMADSGASDDGGRIDTTVGFATGERCDVAVPVRDSVASDVEHCIAGRASGGLWR